MRHWAIRAEIAAGRRLLEPMRICLVLHDPQPLGGLEEYATTLAIGLQQQDHQVSVLSTTWAPPDNQYLCRLRESGVKVVQVPKWLSRPASHWPTKERIGARLMFLISPLTWVLAVGLVLVRRCSWRQARISAHGWLRGQLWKRFIGPNRYQLLARLLLNWWRLRWRPDLLHLQGYTRNLLFAVDWAHAKGLPVVYEEHQTPDARFDWWQGFEKTINKAARVVAVSETSAHGLRTVCGVTQPIVVRSPLLPDPTVLGWQPDARPHRLDGPLRVTTVARLSVAKGLSYLLETIALLKATHPDVQFSVYGDGPLRDELLAYAARLGLDGSAIFLGPFTSREELSRIMAETDIFVMSSILEGQPLGLVEAMAYGRPIVATSVGGIPELITDGVNGLLCRPADPESLAQKIRALLDDSALRARLGRAARTAYERGPFQPAAVCAHLALVYGEVLQEARLRSGQGRQGAPSLEGQPR